jgi:16S rRNA C1402 N4-methylase RsmH
MRLRPDGTLSAKVIVNRFSEAEIADILFTFGEERASRKIARALVEARNIKPLETTWELARVVEKARPRLAGQSGIHPATRTFMALRLAVNGELNNLRRFLKAAPLCLKPGGRLAVISFHSLEDRLVKRTLRGDITDDIFGMDEDYGELGKLSGNSGAGIIKPENGTWFFSKAGNRGKKKRADADERDDPAPRPRNPWLLWRRKALRPSGSEVLNNPRARSARLRVAEIDAEKT